MIRGLAALAVMIGHVRALFFVDYAHVLKGNALVSVVYLLTGLGHQAVLVFFVLSGFFISRSVLDSFRGFRWSWAVYLINRLTRLMLVLIPSLLLCAFWDRIGMRLSGGAHYYDHSIPMFGPSVITANSSIGVLLGNLFFLQSIYFPPFGSNMPLWSLSYEFWYYILFPILLSVFCLRFSLGKRLGYLVLGSAICWTLGAHITLVFLVWLGGVGIGLLHDWRSEHIRGTRRIWLYTVGALGVVAMLITKMLVASETVVDFSFSAAFMPAMYALLETVGSGVNETYAKLAKFLSSFSYTLYLAHLPLLVFLRAFFGSIPRWQPDFTHALYGAILTVLVLSYSVCLSRLTEFRTDRVRRALLLARQYGLHSAFTRQLSALVGITPK
jgi:peptidoglycan/LPS O-acetylase OafA/YrhL